MPPEEPRRRRRRAATPEERAYREARRAANRKIGFLAHLVPYCAVNLLVLVTGGFRAFFFTALGWGIGLAVHYFFAIVAPELRERLVDREVSQRVDAGVSAQRVDLEGRHARNLEELSASIAHEIRNPITAAKSLVQQVGEDPAAADNVEYAAVALQELERVERSISHLLRFARDEDVELSELRIADVVHSAIETFRDRIAALGVRIDQDVDAAGPMRGDPEKLRRVILNLLRNALDAFQDAGTPEPRIRVEAGENLAGTEVWVRLRDNGPGIEPERLPRIFSPFYTSKDGGTGLGLAITKKVVDAHGGSIEAHSSPGSGTEFLLTFPKQGEGPAGARS
jgi:signal transduction histidine kinase